MRLFLRTSPFPNKFRNKILLAENLIANLLEILLLAVINTDKDNAVLRKQTLRHLETRIDHIQPVRVKAPVAVQILFEVIDHIPMFIIGNIRRNEIPARHRKVIIVYEVIPRIIRRIDIYAGNDTI